MVTIYGIRNCDSVKKTRYYLEKNYIDYIFHDFDIAGISREIIERWLTKVDWETLLNRKSTTWRELPDSEKADIDAKRAVDLMIAHPKLIKRPVMDNGKTIIVGLPDSSR